MRCLALPEDGSPAQYLESYMASLYFVEMLPLTGAGFLDRVCGDRRVFLAAGSAAGRILLLPAPLASVPV